MSGETLSIVHVVVDTKELKGWQKEKKRQFLMLTSMLSDLTVFHKLLTYLAHHIDPKEPEATGEGMLKHAVFLILTAKIFEMYKFIEKSFPAKTANLGPPLDADAMRQELDQHFEENNARVRKVLDFVRNKLAFHFECETGIDKAVEKEFDALDTFHMWLPNDPFNEILRGARHV